MNLLISIIMPHLNRVDLVREAVNSVLNQSYASFELLIIDDGSDCERVKELQEFVKTDQRIKLFKRECREKGASVCRNIGLVHSEGAYVVFLDSDDLLVPDALEERVRAIEQFPNYDLWVFNSKKFWGNLEQMTGPLFSQDLADRDLRRLFLSGQVPFNITCPIWRKEFLVKINGFNEKFQRLQDVELATKALLHNARYKIFAEKCDSLIRKHSQIYTSKEHIERVSKSALEFLHMLSLHPLTADDRKCVAQFYSKFLRLGLIYGYRLKPVLQEFILKAHAMGVVSNRQKQIHSYLLKTYPVGVGLKGWGRIVNIVVHP